MKVNYREKYLRLPFTLIELLVVISIIGMLAALLMPVLQSVKANAEKSSCLNNLHQIGIAVNSYVNEYDGRLPICQRIPDDINDPFGVMNIIKIENSKDIYRCPGDKKAVVEGKTYFERYGVSYEWNSWLNGRIIDKTGVSIGPVILDTPLLGDGLNFHGKLGRNYLYPTGEVRKSLKNLIKG